MAIDLLRGLADRFYQEGNWASALNLYRNVLATDAGASAELGYRLAIGHCEIELADPATLGGLALEADAPSGSERERIIAARLRLRARDLCRAGDAARAARLLRLLATCDPPIAEAYAAAIDAPPSTAAPAAGDRDPPFLGDLADLDVEAVKRRMRGLRVLLGFRRFYYDMPERRYEPPDLFARSAAAFGLTVDALDLSALEQDTAGLATALYERINEFRPDVIVYEGLFTAGASAVDETVASHVGTVLDVARRYLGVRVVKCVLDAWRVPADRLFRGVGSVVDLVHHGHPAILERVGDARRRVFCYVPPLDLPTPTAEAGTLPGACFAGTISAASIARLVWWAEAGARNLPIRFYETDAAAPAERPDTAFADLHRAHQLCVNFTRRSGGAPILTWRTIQTLLAGGVLLEERSRDSAHFLKPGIHYEEFATIAELAAVMERLLGDPEARARLAAAGAAWARRYFTGDYFWAGLLDRLLAGGR